MHTHKKNSIIAVEFNVINEKVHCKPIIQIQITLFFNIDIVCIHINIHLYINQ